MVASQAVQHATPGLSFDAGSQKPAFTPIRVLMPPLKHTDDPNHCSRNF